jgi:hypothetical protein
MSAAAGERPETPAAEPESNEPGLQSSKVLPELWQRLKPRGCLTVLELGRALPETVNFFAGQRCRIHVVDLFGELASGNLGNLINPKTLERQFQDLFGFPPGTRLDLCLLWDLTHYLDEKRLRAFSRALWPWLAPETLAHSFGVRSAGTDLLNRDYGILSWDTLSVRRRATAQLPCKPHPPSFMNEWLTCFTTGRGVLLPDGRVETLMVARL